MGLVASLAPPGGNVTGLSNQSTDLRPSKSSFCVRLFRFAPFGDHGEYRPARCHLGGGEAKAAARTLGIESTRLEIRRLKDIPTAFNSLKGRAEALHLASDHLLNTNRLQVNTLALAGDADDADLRALVETGGLMFYGPNFEPCFACRAHACAQCSR